MRFAACVPPSQVPLPLGFPWAEAARERWFAEREGVANSVVALAAQPASVAYFEQAPPQLAIASGVLSALAMASCGAGAGQYGLGLYWPAPALLRVASFVPLETPVPSALVPSPLTSPASYQEQYCSMVPAAPWSRGKEQIQVKGAISVKSKRRAPPASAPAPRPSKKAYTSSCELPSLASRPPHPSPTAGGFPVSHTNPHPHQITSFAGSSGPCCRRPCATQRGRGSWASCGRHSPRLRGLSGRARLRSLFRHPLRRPLRCSAQRLPFLLTLIPPRHPSPCSPRQSPCSPRQSTRAPRHLPWSMHDPKHPPCTRPPRPTLLRLTSLQRATG